MDDLGGQKYTTVVGRLSEITFEGSTTIQVINREVQRRTPLLFKVEFAGAIRPRQLLLGRFHMNYEHASPIYFLVGSTT